jgi:hypothetical protein
MTVYPNRESRTLSDSHREMLFEESGISPDVAAERGYYTARKRSEVPEAFKDYQRKPGLVVPMFSPDGETVGCQIRPDRPRSAKLKYESPQGSRVIVDTHPRVLEEVCHGDGDLWVVEGAKKADALVSQGAAAVALTGVWMAHVPKSKPKRLLPCWDHVRLAGRRVFVAFDSDWRRKETVHDALEWLVGALEDRGADVRVAYLEDDPDGEKVGADDYLVAGGTAAELKALCRKFERQDVARIRLSKDEKLRAAVGYLWRQWREGDWMGFVGAADKGNWQRGHTARDAMEALIELATSSGKTDGRGVVVRVGLRRLSRLAAKSAPSVGDAMKHLEADGQLEILPPEDRSKARRYRLLVPAEPFSAALYSMERDHVEGTELEDGDRRCKGLRYPSAPRLRWSSPAQLGRLVRTVEGASGRTVTEAVGENIFVPPDHRPYGKRLGPHRGAVLDTLEASGGEMHLKDLCEALHRKRPWDVRRRILKPLEKAGIIECEDDVIRLVGEWLARLDERRESDGEIDQAERQAKKHRRQSESYRVFLEREKNGTPEASTAAVRRSHDLRDRRMREAREEEKRRVAPVPAAVKDLVARIMHQNGRIRMGLMCGIAAEEGLHADDVPRAVEALSYTVERLVEFDNEPFVFAPAEAA